MVHQQNSYTHFDSRLGNATCGVPLARDRECCLLSGTESRAAETRCSSNVASADLTAQAAFGKLRSKSRRCAAGGSLSPAGRRTAAAAAREATPHINYIEIKRVQLSATIRQLKIILPLLELGARWRG